MFVARGWQRRRRRETRERAGHVRGTFSRARLAAAAATVNHSIRSGQSHSQCDLGGRIRSSSSSASPPHNLPNMGNCASINTPSSEQSGHIDTPGTPRLGLVRPTFQLFRGVFFSSLIEISWIWTQTVHLGVLPRNRLFLSLLQIYKSICYATELVWRCFDRQNYDLLLDNSYNMDSNPLVLGVLLINRLFSYFGTCTYRSTRYATKLVWRCCDRQIYNLFF